MARVNADGERAVAQVSFNKDDVILSFERNFIDHPTNKTLRIDERTHQISTDPAAAENFINHSCEPNAYIGWHDLSLRALKDIAAGEEITYNYFTSDWDGEDVFDCTCKAPSCKKRIAGFNYLSDIEKREIEHLLSPFLRSQLTPSRKKIGD